MLLKKTGVEVFLGELGFISWAELAVLAAVATHSYSWMLMRHLIKVEKYAPSMINGMCMTIGGIAALITALFVENPAPIADMGSFISWLLVVIIISNVICHNLYGHLLKKYSATFIAFAGFMGPLFTAFYDWLFFNEKVTWSFCVSSVFVFIGLYLFYQHELQSSGGFLKETTTP